MSTNIESDLIRPAEAARMIGVDHRQIKRIINVCEYKRRNPEATLEEIADTFEIGRNRLALILANGCSWGRVLFESRYQGDTTVRYQISRRALMEAYKELFSEVNESNQERVAVNA